VEKLQLAVAEISRQLQQRHENAGKTPNHMIRKVSVKRGKK
jgi:hypothetical protein